MISHPRSEVINALKATELPKGQLKISTAALLHNAHIIGECYRVRVLFDTEHQKDDRDYIAVVEDVWLRTFKNVDPEMLSEAVQEFIVSDKGDYLPKPGQIIELLVKSIKKIEGRKRMRVDEFCGHHGYKADLNQKGSGEIW